MQKYIGHIIDWSFMNSQNVKVLECGLNSDWQKIKNPQIKQW